MSDVEQQRTRCLKAAGHMALYAGSLSGTSLNFPAYGDPNPKLSDLTYILPLLQVAVNEYNAAIIKLAEMER